jgi:hypothetical protein
MFGYLHLLPSLGSAVRIFSAKSTKVNFAKYYKIASIDLS